MMLVFGKNICLTINNDVEKKPMIYVIVKQIFSSLLSVSVFFFHVGFPLTFRCNMARWLSQDEAKGLESSMVSRRREPRHRWGTRQSGNGAGKSEAGTVSRPTVSSDENRRIMV